MIPVSYTHLDVYKRQAYTDTESYQVTRMFIEQREGLLKKLLEE